MSAKVLLCDDEVHILRAVEIKLLHNGFSVRCASNGQEGWELIQSWQPDIVVTDLQMPRMDGLQLTRRIRSEESTCKLPVLMLTAKGFESGYKEAAAELGVAAVLPKPFSSKELIRCIQKVLGLPAAGAVAQGPSPSAVAPPTSPSTS